MQTLKTWLQQERGRQAALAKHLGVSPPNVVAWSTGEKPIPLAHGAQIDLFTGGAVTRKEMFPDSWRRIWPELAKPVAVEEGQGVAHG
jgi:DNA-binding transcriptional regulator YdaS (Cro superfamily)